MHRLSDVLARARDGALHDGQVPMPVNHSLYEWAISPFEALRTNVGLMCRGHLPPRLNAPPDQSPPAHTIHNTINVN